MKDYKDGNWTEAQDYTPQEWRQEHRKAAFSGNDWYKLFLVLVGIYYFLKIMSAFR